MVTITIYFLTQKVKKKYVIMSMNGKLECYKGKDGDVQYTRVDKKDKVSIIVDRLLQNSARCLK